MTQIKDNATGLLPALSDFFETDKWISPEKIFRGFHASLPAANVSETDKEYRIELVIPGFKKEEVKVNVQNEVLEVSAETRTEKEEKNRKFTRKEFSYGSFNRSFQLPKAADLEKISAKYDNGLLKLEIPKKEDAGSKVKKAIKVG